MRPGGARKGTALAREVARLCPQRPKRRAEWAEKPHQPKPKVTMINRARKLTTKPKSARFMAKKPPKRRLRVPKSYGILTAGRASVPHYALVNRGQELALLVPAEVILYPLAACGAQPYAKCRISCQPG